MIHLVSQSAKKHRTLVERKIAADPDSETQEFAEIAKADGCGSTLTGSDPYRLTNN